MADRAAKEALFDGLVVAARALSSLRPRALERLDICTRGQPSRDLVRVHGRSLLPITPAAAIEPVALALLNPTPRLPTHAESQPRSIGFQASYGLCIFTRSTGAVQRFPIDARAACTQCQVVDGHHRDRPRSGQDAGLDDQGHACWQAVHPSILRLLRQLYDGRRGRRSRRADLRRELQASFVDQAKYDPRNLFGQPEHQAGRKQQGQSWDTLSQGDCGWLRRSHLHRGAIVDLEQYRRRTHKFQGMKSTYSVRFAPAVIAEVLRDGLK
jgi:hypothetical protein